MRKERHKTFEELIERLISCFIVFFSSYFEVIRVPCCVARWNIQTGFFVVDGFYSFNWRLGEKIYRECIGRGLQCSF